MNDHKEVFDAFEKAMNQAMDTHNRAFGQMDEAFKRIPPGKWTQSNRHGWFSMDPELAGTKATTIRFVATSFNLRLRLFWRFFKLALLILVRGGGHIRLRLNSKSQASQ